MQVLFFEQLRLRTSIAGWFFVSDNLDHPRCFPGNNDPSGPADHALATKGDPTGSSDAMKLRVEELEKECMSMRQEIEKLGKPKSSWSFFSRRFGFGSKEQQPEVEKGLEIGKQEQQPLTS